MAIETTYSDARAHFAELCNRAVDDCETIIVKRRGGKNVAIVSADELESLKETAYLLRSPRNAERLQRALERANARTELPSDFEETKRNLGLTV